MRAVAACTITDDTAQRVAESACERLAGVTIYSDGTYADGTTEREKRAANRCIDDVKEDCDSTKGSYTKYYKCVAAFERINVGKYSTSYIPKSCWLGGC